MKPNSTKRLNKKAVLFTLISVLLAALFIAMFSYDNTVNLDDKIPAVNLRVKILDNYVRDFENYFEDSIEISSYRALESLTNYQATLSSGEFFPTQADFQNAFSNCTFCGRFDCSSPASQSCGAPLADGGGNKYDLNSTIQKIVLTADTQLNIETQYMINSLTLDQKYPFEVEISLDISYNITDKTRSYASWSRRAIINKNVSIEYLTDPTEAINTNNAYRKPIKRTAVCNYDEGCWNLSNVQQLYSNQEFKYSKNAPSYISRFWDSTDASECCGIESLVDVTKVPNAPKSYIDRFYWNIPVNCATNLLGFDVIAQNFKMDRISAIKYNITEYGNLPACS